MTKGASVILLAFLMLLSFPLWVGLIAGGFGLIVGLCGAVFGLVAGIFGAIFGVIGFIFDAVFGSFNWIGHDNYFSFPHVHLNGFTIAVLVIIAALVVSKREKKS